LPSETEIEYINQIGEKGEVDGAMGYLTEHACIHCKLEQLLKTAELNRKLTPSDLLFKYGKIYHVALGDRSMITGVPKKVRDLDESLGLNIFPI